MDLTSVQMMFIAIAEQEIAKAQAGQQASQPGMPHNQAVPTGPKTYTADEYRQLRHREREDMTKADLDERAEQIKKETKEKYPWVAESGH